MHLCANAAGSVSGFLLIYVRLNLFIAHTHSVSVVIIKMHLWLLCAGARCSLHTLLVLQKLSLGQWLVGVSFVMRLRVCLGGFCMCLFPVDKLQPSPNCADK